MAEVKYTRGMLRSGEENSAEVMLAIHESVIHWVESFGKFHWLKSLKRGVHMIENFFVSADTDIWDPRKPNYLPITDICPSMPITFYLADNFLSAR